MANGSGDFAIAFSTHLEVRRTAASRVRQGSGSFGQTADLANDAMNPIFQATMEATEEAIYNSLFRASTVIGDKGTLHALPIAAVLDLLRTHGRPPNR